MSDLKLIDELCVHFKPSSMSWAEFEASSLIVRDAMDRLRSAWLAGEMPVITTGLAFYFRVGAAGEDTSIIGRMG